MDREIPILTFNIDLNDYIFRAVSGKFLQYINDLPPSDRSNGGARKILDSCQKSSVHVAFFFERSLESSRRQMISIEEKLLETFETLADNRTKLSIGTIILVDCGEVEMVPLSPFVTVQNIIEYVSQFVSENTDCRVFTIDRYGDVLSEKHISVHDTSTVMFRNRLWAYFESSLDSLNQKFGADPLPKF